MAVPGMDASLLEIANTLDLARVPDKLHCAACHGLLINAYKTGCCESSLCEPCFSKSPDACPVCDHKPFSDEICKPSKAMRNTVKAYLKTQERARAEELAQVNAVVPTIEETSLPEPMSDTQVNGDSTGKEQVKTSTEPLSEEKPHTHVELSAEVPRPSIEVAEPIPHESQSSDKNEQEPTEAVDPNSDVNDADDDDEVVIQVESDEQHFSAQRESPDEDSSHQQNSYNNTRGGMRDIQQQRRPSEQTNPSMHNGDFQNAMSSMGFGNADFTQMMQMMAQGTMNGFNPLMGMPMGMMPMMNMLNGFAGPNGNMNSMNMGMNYNQNMSNGYGNQNNNMWQNNNGNSFANGMADFASQFAYNMNQQQQFPNGDFQSGYQRGFGRNRGRGRGNYGRTRGGGFNPYPQNHNQNFPGTYEQQQQMQQMQQQMQQHFEQNQQQETQALHQVQERSTEEAIPAEAIEDIESEIMEFAPGGQEDVREALGEDYDKPTPKSEVVSTPEAEKIPEETPVAPTAVEAKEIDRAGSTAPNGILTPTESRTPTPEVKPQVVAPAKESKPIAAAYEEDLEHAMPPPSAPLGPSGRHGDHRDYGFRAPRGHGRFGSRGRGSIHITNARPVSPTRRDSVSQTPPSSEPKGTGVQGAPTGPRAMREPAPAKPARTASSGGFQIMGRAAMASQNSQPRSNERKRSLSPAADDDQRDDYNLSRPRTESRHDVRETSKYDEDSDHYNRERDRKRRKSKYDDYDDQQVNQRENFPRSREESPERKSSHRSHRERDKLHEKDKYSSDSKHRTSSSRKYYADDTNGYDHEDDDDYGESIELNRDGKGADSHYRDSFKYRSSKSSKYEDPPSTASSNNKHREERHRDRKRSRHERDYEDDHQEDEYDNSNHRSRRHKKDHQQSTSHREESSTTINERSTTNRKNETTASAKTTVNAARPAADANKDPHTLEREARNRERMLKEQQRREQAANVEKRSGAKSTASTGRRMTFRSEDEAERRMLENERATARRR